MAELTQDQIRAEADARVLQALEHIEAAQRQLDKACQALCPIRGGLQQYERAGKLHTAIETHWHRLNRWAREHRGRLDLDEFGRSALAKRLGEEAPRG